MDNRYFPHAKDGSINPTYTFPMGYNLVPENAVAVDPRTVISEWTDESQKALHENEIYIGQEIYSLNDKTGRICRYIPNASKFSAYDCVWDIAYSSDTTNNWYDVTTYQPMTVEDKIENALNKLWQLKMNQTYGYWGFYDFGSEKPSPAVVIEQLKDTKVLNKILNNIITNNNDRKILAGSLMAAKTRVGNILVTVSDAEKDKEAFLNAKGKTLIIFIPDSRSVKMTSLNVNDNPGTILTKDLNVFEDKLICISAEDKVYDYIEVGYKAYAWTNGIFNDTTLTISYTLERP